MSDNIIGITEERLSALIAEATRKGYALGRAECQNEDWLNSRMEIIRFLSPDKPMSPSTFNRKRSQGEFGTAIIGQGHGCKARKSELLDAIKRKHLLTL